MKKRVAVFFGGRSPEHDVSIVSALQAMSAIDTAVYDPFAVYVTTDGKWLVGDVLRDRANYFLDKNALKQTRQVTLDMTAGPTGRLIPINAGFFAPKAIEFDIALLMFHGINGEDGTIQGALQFAGIAYTGPQYDTSGIYMDKVATKRVIENAGIPVLPFAVIKRPTKGFKVDKDAIKKQMGNIAFPCILKPNHLGSSIGIAKVNSLDEVQDCLPAIFDMDDTAILEPFVQNLTEYNVAVTRIDGNVRLSAIERPKATEELLDFKTKYLSGGDNKSGTKTGGTKNALPSEGMLSLTREINPAMSADIKTKIETWSRLMFDTLDGNGAPRIDYICNGETGEIWLNEVNPIPGSYGFFLWEAAPDTPLLFTELLTHLLQEAETMRKRRIIPADPVPKDAHLFKRS